MDSPFIYLQGQWRLDRMITDFSCAQTSKFEGTVDFVKESDEVLFYREKGSLSVGNWQGEGYRNYRYQFESSHVANVYFDDGRLFYILNLTDTDTTQFQHQCGDDLYEGDMRIHQDSFGIDWRIRGPRKDLQLLGRYWRPQGDSNPCCRRERAVS